VLRNLPLGIKPRKKAFSNLCRFSLQGETDGRTTMLNSAKIKAALILATPASTRRTIKSTRTNKNPVDNETDQALLELLLFS
jgi:hypothetical protein